VAADGVITPEEAGLVLKWAEENRDASSSWPADVLYARIREMLVDHTLDETEQSELLGLLREITGGDVPLRERVASYSSQPPLTKPAPKIDFAGRQFCMTGKFIFGSRRRCHEVISTRGGEPQATPTQATDFLVIGAIGSTDWIHSTHGRKIETAVRFQRQGVRIAIVSEEHWVSFLG
jgi:NAD-dependent DNA ligase